MLIKGISRLICTRSNNYFDKIISFTKLTKYCNTCCNDDFLLGGKNLRLLHTSVNLSNNNQTFTSTFDNMRGDDKKGKLRAVRLREQRKKSGKNNPNEKNPAVSLQILGSGTKHSPPSVMIVAGNNR